MLRFIKDTAWVLYRGMTVPASFDPIEYEARVLYKQRFPLPDNTEIKGRKSTIRKSHKVLLRKIKPF